MILHSCNWVWDSGPTTRLSETRERNSLHGNSIVYLINYLWYFIVGLCAPPHKILSLLLLTIDSLLNNTTMLATTHCRLYSPKGSEMRIKAQVVCPNKDVPGNLQRLVEGAPYPTPCKWYIYWNTVTMLLSWNWRWSEKVDFQLQEKNVTTKQDHQA